MNRVRTGSAGPSCAGDVPRGADPFRPASIPSPGPGEAVARIDPLADGTRCVGERRTEVAGGFEFSRPGRDLERFRAAMETTTDAIFMFDVASMAIVGFNGAACALSGYARADLLTMEPARLLSSSREALDVAWRSLPEGDNAGGATESFHQRADGRLIPVDVRRRSFMIEGTWMVVYAVRDLTVRKRIECALQRQVVQQRLLARFGQIALENPPLRDLMSQAVDVIRDGLDGDFSRLLEIGPDDRLLHLVAGVGWNGEWEARTVFDAVPETEDRFVLGARESIVIHDFDAQSRQKRSAILKAHAVRSAVEVLICGAGGTYGVLGAYSRRPDTFGREAANFAESVAHILAAAIERRHVEDRLTRMAQFDDLTNLPNRTLFLDRLGHTLFEADHDRRPVGVMFLDLDRFKEVNDSLGHGYGDVLLVEFARRLRMCTRQADTVGRLGGDEFAIVLSPLARAEDAATVAQKIMVAMARPFVLGPHETYISTSIGIGLFPNDGADPDTLLKHADIAMYRAKETGRAAYQFYMPEMNELALRRLRLQSELRGALDRDEFVICYQPKVSLATGRICGLEALLRWKPADRPMVSPADFIPVIEENGLIVPIGEWVISQVCAQMRLWQKEGIAPSSVAVNLSARQFRQSNLVASIAGILDATGIDPRCLELELTESILMSDSESAVLALRQIKRLGVLLSVDDFGTGYSSLAYLRRFPLDALKIDREFVRDLGTEADDGMIAKAIIDLARSLKLKVIAEGVETVAQLEFLGAHACDEIQGFLFSKPLPCGEIDRMLREGKCIPPRPVPVGAGLADTSATGRQRS